MNRSRIAILVVALCGALFTVPATASASDQSIWDTWNGAHAKALNDAADANGKAVKRMVRSEYRKPRLIRKAIRSFNPLRRVLGKIAAAVREESASSENGRDAKALILKSLRTWRSALALNQRALRQVLRGNRKRAQRMLKRVVRMLKKSESYARRATELLEAEGVETSVQKAATS